MKKTLQTALAFLSALSVLSGSALTASAGSLTPEELYDKYAATVQAEENDDNRPDYVYFEDMSTLKEYDIPEEEWLAKLTPGSAQDSASVVSDILKVTRNWMFNLNQWCHVVKGLERVFTGCEEEDGFYYVTREDGTANIVGCDLSLLLNCDGVFRIPSEVGGKTVTRIENYAFTCSWGPQYYMRKNYAENFAAYTDLILPEHLEEIGEFAFYYFPTVQVKLPDTLKFIGQYAFAGKRANNSALDPHSVFAQESIVLPESMEYIGKDGLGGNRGEVTLPSSPLCMYEGIARWEDIANDKYDMHPYTSSSFDNLYSWDDLVAAVSTPQEPVTMGDLNEDGEIDVRDAVMLARLAAGDSKLEISDAGKRAADMNGDGCFTDLDVTALTKQIANCF